MSDLVKIKCIPCRGGDPPASQAERNRFLPEIPEWKVGEEAGVERLVREFPFNGYLSGVEFAVKVGNMAEEEDHHPAILIEWRKVTVFWWTHIIKGLHMNDFVLAARTDQIFHEAKGKEE